MKKKIDSLDKGLLAKIVNIILSYKKAEKIVLFGSRTKDDFKSTSDIDIAIFGKDWSDRDINLAKHALDEYIKTPLKFDVLNFYSLTRKQLKEHILKGGSIIYESRKD